MQEHVINPNLLHLNNAYNDDKTGALLEGSSRSAKTWSSVDFIVALSSQVSDNDTINIIKETYNSFKTTLYDDFNRRLPMYGISSPFADRQEVKQFKLFGTTINLLGAENRSVFSGVGCDYAYFNEMLDIHKEVFDDTEQRCRKFWWGDYNPKFMEHWVYDKVANRRDVAFLKSTYKDNPYLSVNERNKIEGYQSIAQSVIYGKHVINNALKISEDSKKFQARQYCLTYDVNKNVDKYSDDELAELLRTRRNEEDGTVDEYRWNVFGLGIRSAPEGLVFQHVTWINKFPTNIERIYYGGDIGYTSSPSTIVKVGVDGRNIYLQCLFCEPTPTENEFVPAVREHVGFSNTQVLESADGTGYGAACRRARLKVVPVTKFDGSIKYGISLLKKYKIHIVDHPEWRKEQGQYVYKTVHGIQTGEPIDEFNHLWDAARYAVITYLAREND